MVKKYIYNPHKQEMIKRLQTKIPQRSLIALTCNVFYMHEYKLQHMEEACQESGFSYIIMNHDYKNAAG